MTKLEFEIHPSGLSLLSHSESEGFTSLNRLRKTFIDSPSAGLLTLLQVDKSLTHSSSSATYWHGFASSFIKTLFIADLHPVEKSKLESLFCAFVETAPPMIGGEYIDKEFLGALWAGMEQHLKKVSDERGTSLDQYLKEEFAEWIGVGCLYFHLAESPVDSPKPFLFMMTFSTKRMNNDRVQHIPLGEAMKLLDSYQGSNSLERILKPVALASTKCKTLHSLFTDRKLFEPSFLSTVEAYDVIQSIPSIEETGIIFKLPRNWQNQKPKAVTLQVNLQKKDENQAALGFSSLFHFSAQLTLDGRPIDEQSLKRALEGSSDLIQIQGEWVQFNAPELRDLLTRWQSLAALKEQGLSFVEAMRLWSQLELSRPHSSGGHLPAKIPSQALQKVQSPDLAKTLDKLKLNGETNLGTERQTILEQHLRATLRPYQKTGVIWLHRIYKENFGGILADDMGLGKTLQTISLLLLAKHTQNRYQKHPSLLVAPASLIENWLSEIKRFAPSLHCYVAHPSHNSPAKLADDCVIWKKSDLVLSSYGMAIKLATLKEALWDCLILDEAQAIKNPDSKTSREIKRYRASCRLALTGTPVENSLWDMWSITDFTCPLLLGSRKQFQSFLASVDQNESYRPLKKLMSLFLLRRRKNDKRIIRDLPDKTESVSYCGLSTKQVALYRKTLVDLQAELKASPSLKKRSGLVLKYLMKTKQICNHPSQVLKDNQYYEADSGKLGMLRQIATTVAAKREKMIVFTQFREMVDILESFLTQIFKQNGSVIHGGMNMSGRAEIVRRFQNHNDMPFLVLSLKAAGTGLNLTRANYVVHFDRWWNPAAENQATDRAYRIGQKRQVMVHKFVCKGTIEEKIDLLLTKKYDLTDSLVNQDPHKEIFHLEDEDLMSFFALQKNQETQENDDD